MDRAKKVLSAEENIALNSSLQWPLKVILAVVLFVICMTVVAGSFVKISGAIVASGELRVLTSKTLIQHETGGRIAELLIANGQNVDAGQVVMRLETEQITLSRSKLLTQIDSLERQSQRLQATLQEDLQQDSDATTYRLSEADIRAREGASIRAVVSRIITFNRADGSNIEALEAVLELQEQQIGLSEIQVDELNATVAATESLVSKGLETEIELKRQRNSFRSQQIALVETQKTAAQTRREIVSLEAQIENRIFEFQQSALEDLIVAEDELARLRAELDQIDQQIGKLEVRAGLSGRITNLAELNVGAVLRASDVVAEIIPVEQEVMAEVFVSASEIDLLSSGSHALLEISTLKRSSEQRLKAKVETVAADLKTFEDGGSAFPVQLRLLELDALPAELVRNGVPVTSYIPTADRSLGSYLVMPIIRWSRKTFTEY